MQFSLPKNTDISIQPIKSFTDNYIWIIKKNKDIEKDSQLRHAVSLLSGWDIMVNGAGKKKETVKPIQSYSQKF